MRRQDRTHGRKMSIKKRPRGPQGTVMAGPKRPAIGGARSGNLLGNFTFTVAKHELRSEAMALRSELYREALADTGLDEYDVVAHQLIAIAETGEVAAALRVVLSEHRPFDFEKRLPFKCLVPADRAVAEVSRFCVHPRYREMTRNQFVHLGMLKLLISFCRHYDIDYVVSLALPHLVSLYQLACFEPYDAQLVHPVWGAVQPITLDLAGLSERLKKRPKRIAALFESPDPPNVIVQA